MKSQATIRSDVYNALKNNITLTDRIYWLGSPSIHNTYPLVIYSLLDTRGDYSFCGKLSELVQIQVDIYTDPSDIGTMDSYGDAVKEAMEGINYQLISSQAELYLPEINKVMRATRWEWYNV